MPFAFQCPAGHVLEAEPAHAGQTCQCPVCGTWLVIPPPPMEAAAASPTQPAIGGPPSFVPGVGQGGVSEPAPAEVIQVFTDPTARTASSLEAQVPFDPASKEGRIYHIPCPAGHVLEVPPDMLDSEALCPHCGVQFRLRERDSQEHRERRRAEFERKEEAAGKLWLNVAIVAAVIVVIALIVMFIALQ